ncbi:hypothetical protein NDU88_005390 [Pleurodeles waltl]|uniref:Uncharacterized protein n=1 Tax=Pleurodeles waltl TaxID=8319 RepID=A0AAV7RP42_PLEWA|nr:hypothetical protein NDU88_005390 [Pleurodeles waltl]
MALIGDDRVAQAVELLREARRLDLLVGGDGDAGLPMRTASVGVAAALQVCALLHRPHALGGDYEKDSLEEGKLVEDKGQEGEEEERWAQGAQGRGGYSHGSSVPMLQDRQVTEVSTQEHIRNARENQMVKMRAPERVLSLMPGKVGAEVHQRADMVSIGVDVTESY